MRDNVYGDTDFGVDVSTTDREASIAFRAQDAANLYEVIFEPDGLPWRGGGNGGIWLDRRENYVGNTIGYAHPAAFPKAGEVARLRVVAIGPHITVYLNGAVVLSLDDDRYGSGKVGLRIFGDSSLPCDAVFANVALPN